MAGKSLEARLFEAFTHYRGVHLTADDVQRLMHDDAVCARITNAACSEAGINEGGGDEVSRHKVTETWAAFKKRLVEQCGESGSPPCQQ